MRFAEYGIVLCQVKRKNRSEKVNLSRPVFCSYIGIYNTYSVSRSLRHTLPLLHLLLFIIIISILSPQLPGALLFFKVVLRKEGVSPVRGFAAD